MGYTVARKGSREMVKAQGGAGLVLGLEEGVKEGATGE